MQRYTCQLSIGGGDIDSEMEGTVKPSQVKQKEKEKLKPKDGMDKMEPKQPEMKKEIVKQNEVIKNETMKQNGDAKKDSVKQNEVAKEEYLSDEDIEEIMNRYDNMTKEQKKRYLTFFKNADQGSRGYLTIRRMVPAVRRLGFKGSNYEICNMFVDLDANMDHKVTLEEYMNQMSRKSRKLLKNEEDIRRAFELFDRNKDGYITREELSLVLKELNIKKLEFDIDRIIDFSDKDRDGKLSFDDFIKSYKASSIPE